MLDSTRTLVKIFNNDTTNTKSRWQQFTTWHHMRQYARQGGNWSSSSPAETISCSSKCWWKGQKLQTHRNSKCDSIKKESLKNRSHIEQTCLQSQVTAIILLFPALMPVHIKLPIPHTTCWKILKIQTKNKVSAKFNAVIFFYLGKCFEAYHRKFLNALFQSNYMKPHCNTS